MPIVIDNNPTTRLKMFIYLAFTAYSGKMADACEITRIKNMPAPEQQSKSCVLPVNRPALAENHVTYFFFGFLRTAATVTPFFMKSFVISTVVVSLMLPRTYSSLPAEPNS